MAGLKNSRVITASRSDKTSFGCEEGSHTTYFGESYMVALRKYVSNKDLSSVNWKQVYEFTENLVKEKEAILVQKKNQYSWPQFYLND